jgi:hypothetical protein
LRGAMPARWPIMQDRCRVAARIAPIIKFPSSPNADIARPKISGLQ